MVSSNYQQQNVGCQQLSEKTRLAISKLPNEPAERTAKHLRIVLSLMDTEVLSVVLAVERKS
jgi:hypothetical protein